MKIFVTGATGYIGSHLVNKLLEEGNTVHALVRSKEKARWLEHPNLVLFEGDILNYDQVAEAMKGCELAYHLAAFAKVWAKDVSTYFRVNVDATRVVLKAAKDLGIQRTVVTSTAGVYGASINGVVHEDFTRDLDFFNEYESSKALAESAIKDFVIDGQDVVIVSPTRVYGPFVQGDTASVTQLIEKFVFGKWRIIPGDGTKIGNYVFIDDVVDGHLKAMTKGRTGHTYILGGENHSYNSFFGILSDASGIKRKMVKLPISSQMLFARFQLMKIPFGGTPLITPKWIAKGKYDWEVSPEKAIKEIELNITPLEEGIKKTVDWLKK